MHCLKQQPLGVVFCRCRSFKPAIRLSPSSEATTTRRSKHRACLRQRYSPSPSRPPHQPASSHPPLQPCHSRHHRRYRRSPLHDDTSPSTNHMACGQERCRCVLRCGETLWRCGLSHSAGLWNSLWVVFVRGLSRLPQDSWCQENSSWVVGPGPVEWALRSRVATRSWVLFSRSPPKRSSLAFMLAIPFEKHESCYQF
jgi:hypothetical protein